MSGPVERRAILPVSDPPNGRPVDTGGVPTSRGHRAVPGDLTGDDPAPLQRQARALGDPTRHALFRLIEDASDPLTVGALAERLGVHESAVRQHLAKLIDAGLVTEERRAPAGPGRPPARYRPVPAVLGWWGTESPYERLSLLLLEVVDSGRTAREVGAEAGRLVARAASGVPGGDSVAPLEGLAAQLGFEPSRLEGDGGCSLVLGRCPYAAAASRHPMVCELHLGLVEGFAAETGGVSVDALHRRDPYQGGCRIDLTTVDRPPLARFRQQTLAKLLSGPQGLPISG